MKYAFHKDFHIATIESEADWQQLRVNTLIQNTEAKQPSINAFLGARYSRSADAIVDIAREIYESGKDASKRLEAIFFNYGHKSVGDMADLFLCLENIPIISAQRFFYLNPVLAGQERSTRYQDFSKPKFINFPKGLKVSDKIRKGYEKIIFQALKNYEDLREPVTKKYIEHFKVDIKDANANGALKARVFDTIRYFVPIGLHTSLGAVMSARTWAERIAYYRASRFSIERELGEMIFQLLIGNKELNELGYLPEADTLIRHSDADLTRNQSSEEILKFLKKYSKNGSKSKTKNNEFDINNSIKASTELIKNYSLLINPYRNILELEANNESLKETVGKIISKYHDHHHQIGNVAQAGSILIEGITDYGVLKDLIRHRSFEKFVPILEENVNMDAELNRETPYGMCNYLEIGEMKTIKNIYIKKMDEYYDSIREWYKLAKQELNKDMSTEYVRYLLTHGHSTKYKFYASIDDLAYTIALRTRNGGHIAYRKLTYDWLVELARTDKFWTGLLNKIPKVEVDSREQFIDRS